MKRTAYKGYRSFAYLEPEADYRAFELAAEIDRVKSTPVAVSTEQEERVQRLLSEHLAISLHDHCFIVPKDFADLADYRRQGRDWTGYAGMARSGLDAVFDCLMDGTATITSKAGWKWDDIIYDLGMRLSDIAHQDFIVRGETVADIKRAKANGQIAFIASLEAATSIENEVDHSSAPSAGCNRRLLEDLGVRRSGAASDGDPEARQRIGSSVTARRSPTSPRTARASAPCAAAARAASGSPTSTITEIPSPSEMAWLNRRWLLTTGTV